MGTTQHLAFPCAHETVGQKQGLGDLNGNFTSLGNTQPLQSGALTSSEVHTERACPQQAWVEEGPRAPPLAAEPEEESLPSDVMRW